MIELEVEETVDEIVLLSIYDEAGNVSEQRVADLYAMMAARPNRANISHDKVSSWSKHVAFVRSKPYARWYLIMGHSGAPVGHIYLSKDNYIGLQILAGYQRQGLGSMALSKLLKEAKGAVYANIAPRNRASMGFFRKHGFSLVQHTYRLDVGTA